MSTFLDQVYQRSPVWVQNLGISLYGIHWKRRRYGGEFKSLLREFQTREEYNEQEWLDYQEEQLQILLRYASRHVPFYQEKFHELGFSEEDFISFRLNHLSKLPVLTKEMLRTRPNDFIATNINEKLASYLTSGTTGTPLTIKFTRHGDQLVQAAYETRVRNWAGVNYKMSRGMIGGRLVVPKANTKPPFWRFNVVEQQLYLSAFHISPKNAPEYARALNQYHPDYLVGYASAHFFLARMLDELKVSMYQPKAILTSSEKLTPEMRKIIEKVYRCEVFDAYSGVEACCQASECAFHNLHISPDVGIIEILGRDDQPVPIGTPGRIIATGLLNEAQPLIRYDTGDMGILSKEACPCGRNLPIIKELIGRLEDTVIGIDGRETVRFHGIFVGIENIREGQIIQLDYDKFLLRLVVLPNFCESDKKSIYERFYQRIGPIQLEFEFVDQIERTRSGKYQAVISKVQRKTHSNQT